MTITVLPKEVTIQAKAQKASVDVIPQFVEIEAKPDKLGVQLCNPVIREIIGGEPYEGEYNVTPTTSEQTFPTGGKLMTQDMVVNPIPQNYGLITWSGAVLTVS